MSDDVLPPGFVRLQVGRADVVCADYLADSMRQAVAHGTLYAYAEASRGARALSGRGIAWAATLPGDVERAVIRHNRHGGLLAPLTSDVFRWPSRAPYELATSERLRRAGVATPTMLGYVRYPVLPGFCRVDVMSREVSDSFDLATILMESEGGSRRDAAWRATAALLASLDEIGARHHDLNAKNVLLRHGRDGGFEALLLDVDRVEFVPVDGRAGRQNAARLLRSVRKWQVSRRAPVTDDDIRGLATLLGAPSA